MAALKRIIISLVIIVAVGSIVIVGTRAFFSDTETSTDNVFTAGAIDLQIDNESYYNGIFQQDTSWSLKDLTIEKFFNFTDVKPNDFGEDTISLHVNTNDAWVCADVKLTSNNDNGLTDNEEEDGDTTDGVGNGELANAINFIWWADDGDNVLENDETVLPGGPLGSLDIGETSTVALADSQSGIWGIGPLPGNTTKYIGKTWCFGTLTSNALDQDGEGPESDRTPANSTGGISCDGSGLGNETQTDSTTVDVTFRAEQSRHNLNFLCSQPEITPTVTPTTTPNPGEPFVDAVPSVSGTFGNCCDANNLESDQNIAASKVTGAPDSPPDSDFIQISDNSVITTQFVDNKAVDGTGDDIRIHVYDALFPANALIEVSDDCVSYVSLGIHADTSNVDLDINGTGLTEVQCVRLTDQVAGGDPYPTLGFDLDAIEALNSIAVP